MKASATNTFDPSYEDEAAEQRFRNQATGIGSTRKASEQTGAMRSQVVADNMPEAQAKCADGYPKKGAYGMTALPATTKAVGTYRLR